MTKIYLGKSSVKTSGTTTNQKSKPSNTSRTKHKPPSPRPSPDSEKEFRRATTTKASSQERNDVTVFEKTIQ